MKSAEIIAQNNIKTTPVRQIILDVLAVKGILSAQEILKLIENKFPTINKTTIYRDLDLFEEKGIIQSFNSSERAKKYELATEDHHHHLVCTGCKSVEHIEDCGLNQTLIGKISKKGFAAKKHILDIFGTCNKCKCKSK